MTSKSKSIFAALITAVLPLFAFAHTGVDAGTHHGAFWVGFAHPLGGLDHISVAIAMGLWATQIHPRTWVAPAVFIGAMTSGALAGINGIAFEGTEWFIATSVLFCAVLPTMRQSRLFSFFSLIAVALFAFAHGLAHGGELQRVPNNGLTLAGLMVCTGLLHVSGIVLQQRFLSQRLWLQRALSFALSVLGLELLLSLSGAIA